MKIKKILILFPLILSLASCNKETASLSIANFDYSSGRINISLNSNGYSSINIYKKNSEGIYKLKETISSNHYSYSNVNDFLKIVPINNGKEEDDKALEFNYFNASFNNNHVITFDPSMSSEFIQEVIDSYYDELLTNEWSSKRVAFLFNKGSYEDVTIKNGYYTTVSGLGYSPLDVSVESVDLRNHPNTDNALINFWRSIENFHVREDSMWAASQAAPIRRMSFQKNLLLSDYRGKQNWSSGGYMANTLVRGVINSGSQQQYYLRNDKFDTYSHASMNMVYEGCSGNMPMGDYSEVKSTIINSNLATYEKPNLVFDNELGLGVNVYKRKENSYSYSWGNLLEEESTFIPLSEFYVVNNESTNKSIQNALDNNKHLLFTPGIYDVSTPIEVNNNNTIILGMGMATLRCNNSETIMNVTAKGVSISGLIYQAGPHSSSLLHIKENNTDYESTRLSDVFFRNGGEDTFNTYSDACLIIDQNDVISDHLWIWRADHGVSNIGWNNNVGKNGLIANGNNLIFHCLMVEHYEEYQSIFNGENITTIFYQSETPYDALTQSEWARGEGVENYGYASYYVNSKVNTHTAYGLGVYFHSISKGPVYCANAYSINKKDGINLTHLVTRHFGGKGGFIHFINEEDGNVDGDAINKNYFLTYY